MARIGHYLHIYQRPAIGNDFLKRKLAFNYNHQITAMGWYDTASCDVAVSDIEGEIALENWIGARVAVFVDNPGQPIWEGLINRLTLETGGVSFTRSLDNMFNYSRATYRIHTSTQPLQTAASAIAASQSIYGIKQGSIESGMEITALSSRTTSMRDLLASYQAWPQSSLAQGQGRNILHVECVGFYQTLMWETVEDTTNALVNPNVIITNALAGLQNTNTFVAYTDTSRINANAAFTGNRYNREGRTVWECIQFATEPGDGSVRWIAGVEPTSMFGTYHRVYYRQSNTAIEYFARVRDGMRIRTARGALVQPWEVRPDRAFRLEDKLAGWNAYGDDPRELYIEGVQYNAEAQSIALQGNDNITVEGAFTLRQLYKRHGARFGAQWRQ